MPLLCGGAPGDAPSALVVGGGIPALPGLRHGYGIPVSRSRARAERHGQCSAEDRRHAPGGLEAPDLAGRLITNYYLLAGLSLFALNVVFYLLALTRLNLSIAYPIMMAGGVVIIVAVSVLLLQEALTLRQAVGLLLLIVGIVLVAERSTA